MDRLDALNAAQQEAVLTLSGPLLVLAGAGTGKTRVITHRTAELIRRGTRAERILSVTFTNKAAREMQARTVALLGRRVKPQPQVSTIHSLCVRILRQEITVLGYRTDFAICDRGDQESAARTALREIRVGEKSLRPGDLLAQVSRWKMAGAAPNDATEQAGNDLDFLAAVAYRRYQTNLRSSSAVDFDDLLLLTHQLFEQFPDALARHQNRFDQVQIDEYQDTNDIQFMLIEALVRPHQNLCVVGDDDQSIYGWRGAKVGHILNFQRSFPGARIVRLEENYRCTAQILEFANRLVRHNLDRHDKHLLTNKTNGSDVRVLEFTDEVEEARSIVREIEQLVRGPGVRAGDVAILFRTNEQPRIFESELRRAKLRYVLIGGQSFFDRREIRDMLAYLKILANPDDEISLLRIINTPARGIGRATVEKLIARAVKHRARLWDVVPQAVSAGEVSTKTAEAIGTFRKLLERFRRMFDEQPQRIDQLLLDLIDEIGYEAEIEKQYKHAQQQLVHSAMLEQLADSMKQYLQHSAGPSLAGYLEESALLGRDEEQDKDEQLNDEAVKLMTLHSAKGLEFPHVYMVGLEEGILPHHRSIEGPPGAIAEERRLAYVGITRAMDHLTLSRSATRMKWGKRRQTIPSRFLFEMREAHQNDDSEVAGTPE